MKDKIADYFANKPEVLAVYIFGSHARARVRPESDVDIGILLKSGDKGEARRKRIQYMVELGKILRKDIHPVIMNMASEELLRQIFSMDICIQVNNENALSHFKTVAISKIAEFGYYRNLFQRGLIRKLQETSPSD